MAFFALIYTQHSEFLFSPRYAKASKDILRTKIQSGLGQTAVAMPSKAQVHQRYLEANLNDAAVIANKPISLRQRFAAIMELPATHSVDEAALLLTTHMRLVVPYWDGEYDIIEDQFDTLVEVDAAQADNNLFWMGFLRQHKLAPLTSN